MRTYQMQSYTIICADKTQTVIGEHLPMKLAQELADSTKHVCLIYHTAGRQYVYPN